MTQMGCVPPFAKIFKSGRQACDSDTGMHDESSSLHNMVDVKGSPKKHLSEFFGRSLMGGELVGAASGSRLIDPK